MLRVNAVGWFKESTVKPAQELARELANFERAKKNRMKPTAIAEVLASNAEDTNVRAGLSTHQGLMVV